MTWGEAGPSIAVGISTLVGLIAASKKTTSAVNAKTTTEGAKTQLRVDVKALEVSTDLDSLRADILTHRSESEDKRILFESKVFETLDAIQLHQTNQDANLRKLVKFIAEKWTEEKTLVKGTKQ